jgi:hypothetical protein
MAEVTCPTCGETVELQKYCKECGADLSALMAKGASPRSAPSVHEGEAPASGPAEIPEGKVKCPFCDEIVEHAKQCGACGAELLIKMYAPCAGKYYSDTLVPEGSYVSVNVSLMTIDAVDNDPRWNWVNSEVAGRVHYHEHKLVHWESYRHQLYEISKGEIIAEIDIVAEPPLEQIESSPLDDAEITELTRTEGAFVTPDDTIAVLKVKFNIFDPLSKRGRIKPKVSGHVHYFRKQGDMVGGKQTLIAEIRKE